LFGLARSLLFRFFFKIELSKRGGSTFSGYEVVVECGRVELRRVCGELKDWG